ncbi:MAG TPA: DUF4405 domain-containing protein [Spirochaetota bacterium]|nr:DUF4405 domain-containing protein [Spirochaetota bacterium]HNT11512.1 DUF4405 domain-containing protein [Spirochaetota bacterium]
METSRHGGINRRRVLFYFMMASFLTLPVSGFLLHVYSRNPLAWQARHACMAVHNLAAVVFLAAVIVHLSLNAKSVMAYVRTRRDFIIPRVKELFIALSVMVVLIVLGVRHAFH